jgi:uncharacterized membrane protein YoaK (UPF0700 family)
LTPPVTLRLGRVFVANMTGNVAFFGFTVDPHSGLSAVASVIAIALLAAALGVQNSTVRHLGAADLTTTVLTLTLTGLAADSALVGGPGAKPRRRLGSAAAAFMTAIAHRDTSHAPPRIVISSARKGTPP